MKIPNHLIQALLGTLFVAACCASPVLAEEASQLVELTKVDPTLRLDIRYASDRNFMGFPLYSEPRAFLQKEAAQALKKVNEELHQQGLGLLILDAYRPWSVTKLMWDKTPPAKRDYVADPQKGSRHNRGAAVDLTIVDLTTGKPVAMPSNYDDFSQKAHHSYQGSSAQARANRAKLKTLMEKHGFEALSNEWWHYDFQGWENYPILDKKFEEI
tara:strand:- start:1044 stop:1685 length:642 start_codon:yes stop_codon:yes gene_type:complete